MTSLFIEHIFNRMLAAVALETLAASAVLTNWIAMTSCDAAAIRSLSCFTERVSLQRMFDIFKRDNTILLYELARVRGLSIMKSMDE